MTKHQIGDCRVTQGEEYDRAGEWAVEEFDYAGSDDKPSWYVPGWVEDRFGESGFFKSKGAALAFLDVATA